MSSQNYSPPPSPLAVDRLSELPDSVLTHLLSFLPTRKCVATSILSRRWRFLWQYVPVIHLHNENPDAISRVLLLHKVNCLDSFRLEFEDDDDDDDYTIREIDSWVIAAIERNARKIYLCFEIIYILPSPLYTCETLVDLWLYNCGVVPSNLTAVSLPRLKKLHLEHIQFEAGESLTRLISGCPVLEELQLRYVIYEDLVRFIISSPTIKRLGLVLIFTTQGAKYYDHAYTVQLNTPALEDLHMDDRLSEQIDSGPLPSLVKARVTFYYNDDQVQDVFNCFRSALNFINKLSEAKSLKIGLVYGIEDRDALLATWTPSSFHQLTTLNLEEARICLLPKFLESANNLQCLYFRKRHHNYMEGEEEWIEPLSVPTCLLSSLRTIQLYGFGDGVLGGIDTIRYLLKNALVLETMKIFLCYTSCRSRSHYKVLIKEISLLERGSETCELIFS